MVKPLSVALTLEQLWHRVPGGTAVAAIGMARALSLREDVQPVGVAARHRAPPEPDWKPPIPVRHLRMPRRALYEAWHRLRRPDVQSATGAVDVIHATSIAIPPRRAPLVVTIHDLAWRRDPGHFTKHGVRFFDRGLELTRSAADLVLAPSEATRRDLLVEGFEEKAVRVVPLGVEDHPASLESVDRVRRHYGLASDYVLWAGTIEPRKNLGALLRAWARVDSPGRLVLAGPAGWNEDLDALVDSSSARDRILPLGFVTSDDLRALYAGARVFCFPSLVEGFGFPVLEAMAQGTPVVTSAGTSTEELSGKAGLLVDPTDEGAIASAIQEILDDPELAATMAAAGKLRAAEFSWARTGELLARAYRDVAEA